MNENHSEIMRAIGNIEGSLKALDKSVSDLSGGIKIQNGRLGKLENWRSYILGAIAIFSFIVMPLIVYIFKSSVENVKAEITKIK